MASLVNLVTRDAFQKFVNEFKRTIYDWNNPYGYYKEGSVIKAANKDTTFVTGIKSSNGQDIVNCDEMTNSGVNSFVLMSKNDIDRIFVEE